MLVAPRISECFDLPWSALVCYSLLTSSFAPFGRSGRVTHAPSRKRADTRESCQKIRFCSRSLPMMIITNSGSTNTAHHHPLSLALSSRPMMNMRTICRIWCVRCLRGSHGLSARRARRTKSRTKSGPGGPLHFYLAYFVVLSTHLSTEYMLLINIYYRNIQKE